MASYPIPSWIQPADTASFAANGFGLGASAGAEAAANRYKEQQIALQAQKMAQEQAQMEAELGLKQAAEQEQAKQYAANMALQQQHQDLIAQQAAQKSAAILSYQNELASGTDPTEAILKYGPMMGQQASPEAAAIREMKKQPTAYIPEDVETGAPGYFQLPGGGIHVPPSAKPPKDAPKWIPENKDTGEPAHWETASGSVHVPGRTPLEGALTYDDRESIRSDRKILTDFLKNTSGIDGKLFKKSDPDGYAAAQQEAQAAADAILELKPNDPQALAIKSKGNVLRGAKSKVDRAHELAKEHPDWSKKQIIEAVNAEGQ